MIKKNKYFLSNSKEGFTLIELIIVIFIIGLLTTIVVISISGAKSKSRDVKRISEITQLQIALDNYNKIEGQYPETLISGEALIGSSTGITFMSKVPINSSYYDVDCYAEGYDYSYDVVKNEYEIAFCLEKKVDNYSSGPKCAIPGKIFDSSCGEGTSSCGGQVADSQGNLYNTVLIGDQCWFQENLRYLPEVHNSSTFANKGDSSSSAYGVYGYEGSNLDEAKSYKHEYEGEQINIYKNFGVLYNWYAAMDGATEEGAQGICPTGWHVPSDTEWTRLEAFLSDSINPQYYCGNNSINIAKSLASNFGWVINASNCSVGNDQVSNNSSGFRALPASVRFSDGNFYYFGRVTRFWSSSKNNVGDSCYCMLGTGASVVYHEYDKQSLGCSVRCLKD